MPQPTNRQKDVTDNEALRKNIENLKKVSRALEALKEFVEHDPEKKQRGSREDYPECPAGTPPPSKVISHPYLPNVKLYAHPKVNRVNQRVTLDGRMAQEFAPREFFFEQPPYNVPPWFEPNYAEKELRSGVMMEGCECWKKNGLQDRCPRWDCDGRPECLAKPLPQCPPSINAPFMGLRKANAFTNPREVKSASALSFPPYPVHELESIKMTYPPNSPALPCPQEAALLGSCP